MPLSFGALLHSSVGDSEKARRALSACLLACVEYHPVPRLRRWVLQAIAQTFRLAVQFRPALLFFDEIQASVVHVA